MPEIRRMRDLRGAGLGCAAIAAVMALDHDLGLSARMVRYYLGADAGGGRRLGLAKPAPVAEASLAGRSAA